MKDKFGQIVEAFFAPLSENEQSVLEELSVIPLAWLTARSIADAFGETSAHEIIQTLKRLSAKGLVIREKTKGIIEWHLSPAVESAVEEEWAMKHPDLSNRGKAKITNKAWFHTFKYDNKIYNVYTVLLGDNPPVIGVTSHASERAAERLGKTWTNVIRISHTSERIPEITPFPLAPLDSKSVSKRVRLVANDIIAAQIRKMEIRQ